MKEIGRPNNPSFNKQTFNPVSPHSPISQPRLSHQPLSSGPNMEQSSGKFMGDELRVSNNGNSYTPGSQMMYSPVSPKGDGEYKKKIPTFLENKHSSRGMKGSMFMGEVESTSQSSPSDNKNFKGENQPYQPKRFITQPHPAKRMPRMSEQPDMKGSSTDFREENQLTSSGSYKNAPSFLQQKSKKLPYQHNESDRPESSKQFFMNKSSIEPVPNGPILSNSYGGMKKSRIETNQGNEKNERSQISSSQGSESGLKYDPTSNWIKKSWSKKKEKKAITIEDFEQIKELGSGKYGRVFLAKEKKSKFICAVKIIQKKLLQEEEITEQFIRQLKIQLFLNHPNIIKMYGFFDDPVNIYILMEVAMGNQLFNQLKKLQSMPELKVAGIMRQVCQAVNELHSNQIIHRDIKPENIVLHQNIIKLCDFGWSVYRDKNMRTTFCGTPLYVGPQILRGKEYDEKIDIWSLGVMMYEMLVGENPFKITREQQLIKIVKDEIKIPSYVEISEQARNFLFCCLQKDPDMRMTIRELINHDFFKKYPEKNDKKMGL